jgi:hypothetical protein
MIGNHELYNFTREELKTIFNTEPEGKPYYSFTPHEGWRFLVLDPYQQAIIGWPKESIEYKESLKLIEAHNPNLNTRDWKKGLTGLELRWLPYNGGLGEI